MNILTGNKICHFSTVHGVSDARIMYRQCVSIAQAGAETHLFAVNDVDDYFMDVTIHALTENRKRISRFFYAHKIANHISTIEPKIIHFHDPELIPFMLKIKKKYPKIKILFDCHEDIISYIILKKYIPFYLKSLVQIVVKDYLRRAALKLDAIITADEGVYNIFKSWGITPTILYNYPPKYIYRKTPCWDFKSRPYDLIYPGSTPQYHLITMFKIACELKKMGKITNWLILTKFCYNDFDWINRKLMEMNLENYFHFIPAVALPILPDHLYKAKIGIVPLPDTPKFHSNIPSKLFDFFAAGLPVVLSDLNPSRRYIKGYDIAIAVEPDNIRAYAMAIYELLEDNKRMIEMGQRARKVAHDNYMWETQTPKLIQLYEELLK